ncbi:MAG: ABC transporter ATP-binding protein [Clostridiales bacterium]|jgi:hypothetical protein|nr:ABC transporter ATP-binding protein [Clostridiales bacterium]
MKKISLFLKYNFSCFLFYLKTVWATRKSVFFVTFIDGALGATVSFIWTFFFKYLLDFLSSEEYNKAVLWVLCCICFSGMIELIRKLLHLVRNNAYFDINTFLERKLSELSFKIPYEKMENAETIQEFEMAHKFIGRNYLDKYTLGLTNIIACIIVFSGVGIITSSLNWWITLMLFSVITVNTICHAIQSQYEMEQFTEETTVSRQLEYTRFWLTEKSRAKEVRTYLLHDFVIDKLKEYNEKFFNVLQNFTKKHKKTYIAIHLINGIQMLIVYSYCAYLLSKGIITSGDFMLYISALFSFSSALTNVLKSLIDMYKNNLYIDKLKKCMDLSDDVVEVELFNEKIETIEFRNVSFCYPGESKKALQSINLVLHRNEKLSLIGENGAGKSTLVKLLLGLYTPTSGEILINGIPMDTQRKNYLPLFSMVFQDYTIFNFSVEENIDMGKKASKEKSQELLNKMGLDSITPETYISQLFCDKGIELSGGENQKLAITRALFKDAPILILDEPTSALSPQSEYNIYKKFGELTSNKMVIFISHRMSSCRICDKILLLQEGKVEAIGTHNQLMESCPKYKEMFDAQAELYT